MPKEVVLQLSSKENKFRVYLPWIIGFAAVAATIATGGYFAGRYEGKANFLGLKKVAPPSTTRPGWHQQKVDTLSIEYPESWGVGDSNLEKEKIRLENKSGQIQVFSDATQEPSFSKEQKEELKESKESEISIGQLQARQIVYSFKDGNFFITVDIPATTKTPLVSFWIAASSEDAKNQALEIVRTFKFE